MVGMRCFGVLIFSLLFTIQLWGQETISQDKITLHSGDVYVGEILMNTPEIIMLRTQNGSRYQFQQSEIKKIEKEISPNVESIETTDIIKEQTDFALIIELAAGTSQAPNCFDWSPNVQAAFILGNKKAFNENLFWGLGIGYNSSFVPTQTQPTVFLPLFGRVQSTLSKKRTSPFVGMDCQDMLLPFNTNYKGGFLVKVSGGISHRITYKSTFFAGVFAGVQTFSGTRSEKIGSDTFFYYGETSMKSLGLKVGLLF